jgi:thioesterase domain-containing protein
MCFVPIGRHLGGDPPCWGVQACGLTAGEEPLATVEEMAARYLAELRRVQPAGPYLLAGWSFGALAAFELACQLEAAGEQVAMVALLDGAPAALAGGGAPATLETPETLAAGGSAAEPVPLAGLLLEMAAYARGLGGKDLRLSASDLAGLGEEEQLLLFLERSRQAGLVHHTDGLAHLRRVVAVFRANVQAFRAYRPRRFGGAVTVVRAAAAGTDAAPDLGWGQVSGRPPILLESPGDHLTMLAEANAPALAGLLRREAARALTPA